MRKLKRVNTQSFCHSFVLKQIARGEGKRKRRRGKGNRGRRVGHSASPRGCWSRPLAATLPCRHCSVVLQLEMPGMPLLLLLLFFSFSFSSPNGRCCLKEGISKKKKKGLKSQRSVPAKTIVFRPFPAGTGQDGLKLFPKFFKGVFLSGLGQIQYVSAGTKWNWQHWFRLLHLNLPKK